MEPEATVAAALREFAQRLAPLDPAPARSAGVAVRAGDADPVVLTESVAAALCAALRSYHDPRDRGRCAQCGGPRLDEGLQCLDCGQPAGLFGQLIRERMARHQ
ncbi:hypothetical protein EDC02_2928 [Micromonospora sp. Llam0]|uniref:hypothetical protein n=1 Tax=Micromonospora sp. Llam0 TaxID=2485143 RepID=UPI000F4665DD|nr:hypothetical protein [Micromonospora sp. Llam0]ROO61006.1 hypothetical protein EDC02_2928 [Micromonospora sp. Llam0]